MSQPGQRDDIKPPKHERLEFLDFSLDELDNKFIAAPFERKVSLKKIIQIADAIKTNRFYNNVFSGEMRLDGKITIYDGQHRIQALKLVRDEDYLTNYDIIIHIYPEGSIREIYRRNNLGLPLNGADHLKSFETKKNPHSLFIYLKKYCRHYRTAQKIDYFECLNCVNFARTGFTYNVPPDDIEEILFSLTHDEIAYCYVFFECMREVFRKIRGPYYSRTIMRNIFRICMNSKLSQEEVLKFILEVKKDKEILILNENKDHTAFRRIFHHMQDNVANAAEIEIVREAFNEDTP